MQLIDVTNMTDRDFDALMDSFESFEDFEVFTTTTEAGEVDLDTMTDIVTRPEHMISSTIDQYGRAVDLDLNPQYMSEDI